MSRPKLELHQFGIMHIMVLTGVVALLCVPIAAFLRHLPAEKQIKALVALSVIFVVTIVAAANVFRRRYAAEQAAGELRMRLNTLATPAYHIANIFSIIFLSTTVGVYLANYVYSDKPLGVVSGFQFIYLLAVWVGASATYLLTFWWWGIDPTQVEICEDGIIRQAVIVTPWTNFHGFRWGTVDQNELFLLEDGDFVQIRVAEAKKEEVVANLPPRLREKGGWS